MYETLPPSLCFPSTIDQYRAKNEVLEKEIPQLQEIAGKVWKKEEELKGLKSELAALDRKIQLELSPAGKAPEAVARTISEEAMPEKLQQDTPPDRAPRVLPTFRL